MSTLEDVLSDVALLDLSASWRGFAAVDGPDDGGEALSADEWSEQQGAIDDGDITGDGDVTADDDAVLTGLTPVVGSTGLTFSLEALSDVVVDLPWLQGVSLVLNPLTFDVGVTMTEDDFAVSFTADVGVRFDVDLLKPMRTTDGGTTWVEDDSKEYVQLTLLSATVTISSDGTIGLEASAGISLADPVMIGQTGVIIESADIELNWDGTGSRPEGTLSSWRGLMFNDAVIRVPELFTGSFKATGLGFGSGGVSGTIGYEDSTMNCSGGSCTGTLAGSIFGLQGGVSSISLTLQQNIPSACSIAAQAYLPFFDADDPLHLDISLSADGGFDVNLAADQLDADGLYHLPIVDVGDLYLAALAFGHEDDVAYVELSGRLALKKISGVDISIDGLRITSDGKVTIEGGWLTLQEPLALDLHGFKCEITRIGFGNEDDLRYIAFDCGVKLADPLPTGVSVEGLRILWDPDGGDPQIRFSGIGLELTIPKVLHLAGEIAYEEDQVAKTHEFKGEATVELLALGLSLDASVLIGRDEEKGFNYIYVYLAVELPVGFPIFATGAAVFGIAGLHGMNVEPDVSELISDVEKGDWYGWYKTASGPDDEGAFSVTDADKWAGREDALAIGAGLTVGTLFDGGRAVSAKGLLLLLIPGPVIMLQVKAGIIGSERTLDALAVLDANAGFFQLNIDVDWELSKIITISASAEAYFDFTDATAWHLYLGQDEPEDKRIHADVLALFSADAYLMLSANGIAQGFGVTLGDSWKFGPVKATLKAWIAAAAAITWRPAQLEGSLGLGGEIAISVAGFSAGISAEALLSGETPTPFYVAGSVDITVNLPWPLDDLKAEAKLEWTKEEAPVGVDPLLTSATAEHLKVTETWILSDDSDKPDAWPIVPLDARLLLSFAKPVMDTAGAGSGTENYSSDQVGDYSFKYELVSVTLERYARALKENGEPAWEVSARAPAGDSDPDSLTGEWAATDLTSGATGSTQLQLFATTPFDFTRRSSRAYSDAYLAAYPNWPCVEATEAAETCTDWEAEDTYTFYGPIFVKDGLTFCVSSYTSPPSTTTPPFIGVMASRHEVCPKELMILATGVQGLFLWIAFPEPVRRVSLMVCATDAAAVTAFSDGERVELSPGVFERFLPAGDPASSICIPQEVVIEANSIEWIKFSTAGTEPMICLCRVCWVTEADALAADRATTSSERQEARIESWGSEEDIFEPEMNYRLTVKTRTTMTEDGESSSPGESTYYRYFCTAGAPGTTSEWDLSSETAAGTELVSSNDQYPNGGALTDISLYVENAIPKDGAVVAYRAYAIGVEFNETYVEQMCGADIVIRVTDPNGTPLTDADGDELELANEWGKAPTVTLSDTEISYIHALSECADTVIAVLADTTLSAGTDALFEDDFSSLSSAWSEATDGTVGTPAVWNVPEDEGRLLETASVSDGDSDRTAPAKLGTMYLAGDEAWTDYSLEVHFQSSEGAIGLVFRCVGEGSKCSYYRLSLDRTLGYRRLVRVVAGEVTTLWEDLGYDYVGRPSRSTIGGPGATLPDAYSADTDLILRVQCQGKRIRAQLDTELLFDLEDDSESALTAGRCGLYTYGNATASFDYVLAQSWPGAYLDPQTQYTAELLASHVLFDQSFRNGVWPVDTDWTATAAGKVALVGQSEWGDYKIEVNIIKVKGSDTVGVVFRWQDEDNNYCFLLETDGSWSIDEVIAGNHSTLASGSVDPDESPSLSISIEGSTVAVSIDSEVVSSFDVASGPGSGQLGLFRANDSDEFFSDFIARSAPRSTIYAWSFVSSAYAGFFELIGDFAETVYTDLVLGTGVGTNLSTSLLPSAKSSMDERWAAVEAARSDLASATDETRSEKIETVEAALKALAATSAEQFDAIYGAVLGDTDYRPLPSVGELNEIKDDDGRYAILLESPEPLDWTRIEIQLKAVTGSGFQSIDNFLLVWSEDGTRAILARTDAADGKFADGSYVLQLAFKLDIGAEAPVLLRGKSSAAEVAAIQFTLG